MDETGVSHINLAYFGTADPAYYRIDCTHLPGAPTFALSQIQKPRLPGYVAIGATIASGVYLDPRWRLFYRAFRSETPVATVGNALKLYWVDQWPEDDVAVESPSDINAWPVHCIAITGSNPSQARHRWPHRTTLPRGALTKNHRTSTIPLSRAG
jgi:hypothetical protein